MTCRSRRSAWPASSSVAARTVDLPYLSSSSVHAPFTEPVGAHLAADVAHHHLRRAAVGVDEPLQLAHRPARVHELHRRQVQAFLEDLPGRARAAARYRAADVALVRHAGAEAHPLALVEDRCQHAHVRSVGAAAAVGVVDDVGVAFLQLLRGKPFEEPLGASREGAHVERQHHVLGDDLGPGVEDGAARVVGFADDGGEARAEERGLHLLHDAVQRGADDLDGDGVGGHVCPLGVIPALTFRHSCTPPSFLHSLRHSRTPSVIPALPPSFPHSLRHSRTPPSFPIESGNPGGAGRRTPAWHPLSTPGFPLPRE